MDKSLKFLFELDLLGLIGFVAALFQTAWAVLTRSNAMPSSYAIGDHFEQFIRQQVESGRYASASEVVGKRCALLRAESVYVK